MDDSSTIRVIQLGLVSSIVILLSPLPSADVTAAVEVCSSSETLHQRRRYLVAVAVAVVMTWNCVPVALTGISLRLV